MKANSSVVNAVVVAGVLALAGSPLLAQEKPALAQAAAKMPGKISVNGVQIPPARVDLFYKRGLQGRPETADAVTQIKEELINREILSQEAIRVGLDKNPEVAAQIDAARQQVLVQAYLQDLMKRNPIKDETLKAEYDRVKSNLGDKEYKAAHILVEKEEEAKQILGQLKKGADFEKIAKEKSKDTGSKSEGGKLDWSNKSSFVAPFTEAMIKLQKGQITQAPVKTDFGYHVIRLDDVRPLKAPSFDEVKENIRQGQSRQLIAKTMADLRGKAKIEEK